MSLKVLIVEDHLDSLQALELYLGLLGYSVTPVTTYSDAVRQLARSEFDVLLCDTTLPDGSGFEIPKLIPQTCKTRKIAMSGYGAKWERASAAAAGFEWYYAKPFEPTELAALLSNICDEKFKVAVDADAGEVPKGNVE